MSIVQFFMLIPKIFFEFFFYFFWKILIFFEKSKKIQKTKFFKNSMHIWDQHEKLHWSCYLHQNRTNLTQLRKSTLKVKKMKKSRKKSKKSVPKKKDIFGISIKNCIIDVIFIKIGLQMWKAHDPMLNFCSGNFFLAPTVEAGKTM